MDTLQEIDIDFELIVLDFHDENRCEAMHYKMDVPCCTITPIAYAYYECTPNETPRKICRNIVDYIVDRWAREKSVCERCQNRCSECWHIKSLTW